MSGAIAGLARGLLTGAKSVGRAGITGAKFAAREGLSAAGSFIKDLFSTHDTGSHGKSKDASKVRNASETENYSSNNINIILNNLVKNTEIAANNAELISDEQFNHITILENILDTVKKLNFNQNNKPTPEINPNLPNTRKNPEPKTRQPRPNATPKSESKPGPNATSQPKVKPGYTTTPSGKYRDIKTGRFVSPKIAIEAITPNATKIFKPTNILKGASKGGIAGILGGMALDYGAEKARETGHTTIAKGLNVSSSTLTGASTGALIGSIVPGIGTTVGGVVGGAAGFGYGLYNALTEDNQNEQQHENAEHIDQQSGDTRSFYEKYAPSWLGGKEAPKQTDATPSDAGGGGDQISNILATIRSKESNTAGGYKAKNPNSSASGAYQFLDGTWQALTKKYNIGTEYQHAMDAPPEIQDAVARNHVSDILKQVNGDVSKIPIVWYTGNPQGKSNAVSQEVILKYQQEWMANYSKLGGGEQIADASKPSEATKTGGKLTTQSGISLEGVDPNVVAGVEKIQSAFGKNLVISSGVRTSATPGVGGQDPHQKHAAVDISYKSSGIGENDIKTLASLALNAGFTGIGLEDTHLHLDNSHAVKTLWGQDYHFGSAPEWAKTMTDWGNAGVKMASAPTSGQQLSAQSGRIEASEQAAMANQTTNMTMNSQSQTSPNPPVLNNNSSNFQDISIMTRLQQTFPQAWAA